MTDKAPDLEFEKWYHENYPDRVKAKDYVTKMISEVAYQSGRRSIKAEDILPNRNEMKSFIASNLQGNERTGAYIFWDWITNFINNKLAGIRYEKPI